MQIGVLARRRSVAGDQSVDAVVVRQPELVRDPLESAAVFPASSVRCIGAGGNGSRAVRTRYGAVSRRQSITAKCTGHTTRNLDYEKILLIIIGGITSFENVLNNSKP